jgi:hypothetical protein
MPVTRAHKGNDRLLNHQRFAIQGKLGQVKKETNVVEPFRQDLCHRL